MATSSASDLTLCFDPDGDALLARDPFALVVGMLLDQQMPMERAFLGPWKLAQRVTCPTLVIYGRKDPLVDPRSAHRVTKHFRDAHVVVLPDSGHVAQMEHPDFVAASWERFLRDA